MSNVLFVYGWGGWITSQTLSALRSRTIAEFGNQIYTPEPLNYTDEAGIARYMDKWNDVQIFGVLSCGCSAAAKIAGMKPKEVVPYAMFFSPSRPCGMLGFPIKQNIARATQVTSNSGDLFNPGKAMLVKRAAGNNVSVIDEIDTGYGHGYTPLHPGAEARFFAEIRATLKPGVINPNRVGK